MTVHKESLKKIQNVSTSYERTEQGHFKIKKACPLRDITREQKQTDKPRNQAINSGTFATNKTVKGYCLEYKEFLQISKKKDTI